ncbi:dephospho-CoA kinase [Candidatus Woesearchaeota archaeon]|nr:MAG: dephospho-CoA kinase [Candidatus Woesearchaeota archaeon]
MQRTFFPVSADPITNWEVNAVNKLKQKFDKVVVGIENNETYTFTLEERLDMAKKCLTDVEIVTVKGYPEDFAAENNMHVLAVAYRHYDEHKWERIKKCYSLGLDVFIQTGDYLLERITTDYVKTLQQDYKDVVKFVPLYVKQKLEEKISKQYIIGVTGEIASGKTFLCNELNDLARLNSVRYHHVNLDVVAKNVLYANKQLIGKTFGTYLVENGRLNVKKLAEIVFSDKMQLEKLNTVMKDPILKEIKKELKTKQGIITLDGALIVDHNITYLCNNNVVLINVDRATQEERLKQRGLTKSQAVARLNSQDCFKLKKFKLEEKIKKDNYGKIFNGNVEPSILFNQILDYFHLR